MKTETFPGVLDSIAPIAQRVVEAAGLAGLDNHQTYELRLAVDELVTNIIVHGYEEAGLSGSVDLTIVIKKESISIALEDTGLPYDPTTRALPTEAELAQPLDSRRMGGLGVFLVTRCVDELRYERVGSKNRTTVILYLTKDRLNHEGENSP